MRAPQLYFACKTQIEKDLTAERAVYFSFFLSRRPAFRLAFSLAEKLPNGLRALACVFYSSFVSARPADFPAGKAVCVSKFQNERKQIDYLAPVLNKFGCAQWNISGLRGAVYSMAYFGRAALGHPRMAFKFYLLFRRICRRYPMYVAMRACEAILNYSYFLEVLRRQRPSFIVSSSDGNPYGRALMAAAWAQNVPLVFASHGAVASKPVRAKASMAILFGRKAEQELLERGSQIAKTLFYGFRQDLKDIRPQQGGGRILICLAHAPDIEFLKGLCGRLQTELPRAHLRVRAHPNSLAGHGDLQRSLGNLAEFSTGGPLQDDLEEAALVVASSSTVHLECLLKGVATVYLPGLDSGNVVPLQFLREDLVFQWENSVEGLPQEKISKFYDRPEFRAGLGEYLNLDSSNVEFQAELEKNLSRLIKC